MNRHYAEGFQRTFTNDIYRVEEQLQAYDKHLYIMWNPNTNEHLVMDGFVEMAIMKIPQVGLEQLDSRVVRRIMQIHVTTGFSAIHELEESERRRERDQQKQMEDLAEDFAKESKEAFVNAYDYGRESGVNKYVGGVTYGP